MRRLFPFLIVAVGLAALAIDFVPNLSRPGTNGDVKIETRLGLDLQGGISVEYQAVTTNGAGPAPGDMATIQTIIENRVNSTGVSEPLVQVLGTDKVIVEVPGAADPDEIRKLVGTTGRLDFVDLPAATYGTGGTTPTTGTKAVPQQGEAIDPTLPVLFSGDQIDPSGVSPGIDPTTNQRVVAVQAEVPGGDALRHLHREQRRPLLRHRPGRHRRLRAGHPERDPQRLRPDHRQLHRRRHEQPRHRPQVRRAAGPAAARSASHRSAPPSAPTSCARRSSPGPSASCSSSSSCSSTTACRASWPASP